MELIILKCTKIWLSYIKNGLFIWENIKREIRKKMVFLKGTKISWLYSFLQISMLYSKNKWNIVLRRTINNLVIPVKLSPIVKTKENILTYKNKENKAKYILLWKLSWKWIIALIDKMLKKKGGWERSLQTHKYKMLTINDLCKCSQNTE